MSKKIIGIPGWSLGDSSFGVTKPYMEFFSQFGLVKILSPQKGIEKVDLLVLSGGLDMSSADYDEIPSFTNSNIDVYKDYFYRQNLKQYIENKIPIFGICLGLQELAVYFGSKLTQNLLYHPYYSDPRTELVHEVFPVTGFNEQSGEWTYKVSKDKKDKNRIEVNSMHHQGLELANMSEDLIPTLLADNYPSMLVEAFIHKELPISAVQFHCEEIFDQYSTEQVENLLEFNTQKTLLK